MVSQNKELHCEDCQFFNEEEVPADCLKGKGKVAFRHPICFDFKLKGDHGKTNEKLS